MVTSRTVNPGIGAAQTYTYEYTGNPRYMWHTWKARFRGFDSVKETDAGGNYVWHYFYTTGLVNGKDADKLTGKEYKTQWYNSNNNLLKETLYDWSSPATQQKYAFVAQFDSPDSGDGNSFDPSGVAVDSANNVYLTDPGNHRILKFSDTGTFLTKWGKLGSGNREFDVPWGIAVDSANNVYVVDMNNHRIQKFDSSGTYITQWGSPGSGNGQLYYPVGIAVSGDNIYVADSGNTRIQKFNSSGTYLGQWECPGNGVAADPATGNVYVAVSWPSSIRRFDSNGTFLGQWGGHGTGDGQFAYPQGVAVDSQGYVYVADTQNHRIQKFNSSGTFLAKWGSYGGGEGQFNEPKGLDFDSSGNIYVVERLNTRIQKFTSSMAFVTIWGNRGSASGRLGDPRGMAIASDNIYVADTTHDRVYKFDPYGTQLTRWGSYMPGMGQFNGPTDAATYGNNVYVPNSMYHSILKFDSSGNFVSQWGTQGSGNGQLNRPQDVAADNNGYIYVADTDNHRIQKFDGVGNYVTQWGGLNSPYGVTTHISGNVYVADTNNHLIKIFTSSGGYLGEWGGYGSGDGQFNYPRPVAADAAGNVYVGDWNHRIQKFTNFGSFIAKFGGGYGFGALASPYGVAVSSSNDIYVANQYSATVQKFSYLWTVQLNQVDETMGAKTSRTKYFYDSYGNVIKTERHGDTGTSGDDSTVYTAFYPNTTAWILNKPARERVYATIMSSDDGGSNLKKETSFYYDGNNASLTTPPTKGDLTRLEAKKDTSNSVSSYYTYDTYGNRLTAQDPNGNTTTFTYDTTYHALPVTRIYPAIGGSAMSESYTWDYGAGKILTETDANSQATSYEYDTFKRVTKLIRPGDSSNSPTVLHEYLNWGISNQEQVKTTQKIDASNSLWKKRYFDGLGRVVQLQAQGETGKSIVTTTAFSNRGLTDKEYVPQNLDSSTLNGYKTPETGWKSTSYVYDGLNRATQITKPDSATISHDYTTAWQDLVTNERGLKKRYYYDAFNRLGKVEELNDSQAVYATTNYAYDVLNNLTQVQDNSSNITGVAYDWLSRKTSMTDPDMGSWSYSYDSNSNLTGQTDARSQTITFSYDVLNRLTGKTYLAGSGMTNVTYSYDSTSGGNYGKGKRTGMTDAPGSAAFTYDAIGRIIKEDKTIASTLYTTQFSYDSADRLVTVTYPTGEVVTQGYNGRGLPYSLSSGTSGTIVSTSLYNQLGQPTEINLGNGLKTTFGYWDVGGSYDTTGGYYSKLWEIKTFKTGSTLQDVKHTWDAGGNLTQRVNVVDSNETESFSYDFLDRLMTASGASGAIGYPLTDGLAARWNLDEGSGTAANDSSGNGNNGVLTNGPAWVDGKLEKALSFDGIDDIVTVADAPSLKFGTGDFTVALWVLTIQDAIALGKYPIAINKDDEQAPRSGWTIYQSMSNNGMNFAILSGGVELTYNSGVTINDGKWHHLVLRKTSTGIQAFIDGELKGTASGSVGSTDKNTPVRIGNGAIADRQWNGKIDEVRIYNRALSGEEINRLYGYSERYTYNAIGNLTSKNGIAYTYGSKPHAVTQVGSATYAYDTNGNMTTRGAQTLTWDVENRPISVNTSPTTSPVLSLTKDLYMTAIANGSRRPRADRLPSM